MDDLSRGEIINQRPDPRVAGVGFDPRVGFYGKPPIFLNSKLIYIWYSYQNMVFINNQNWGLKK